MLLEHGADPHARDSGDNTTPFTGRLRRAAETDRALLDAGADVHGYGDVHELDVIGWDASIGPRIRMVSIRSTPSRSSSSAGPPSHLLGNLRSATWT